MGLIITIKHEQIMMKSKLTTMKTSMETTMVKNGYFISIWGEGTNG
jgi:hypothetical protein